MAITIKSPYVEQQVERERQVRGHKTLSKVLQELALERLTELEAERRRDRQEAARPVAVPA